MSLMNSEQQESLNGVLVLNKPQGFTSFDAIAKLRGILHTRKIGHSGTLDPMATGVLPVFIGSATKAADMLPDSTKSYTARFRLGLTTDTQDITGKVLSETTDFDVSEKDILNVIERFKGEIQQLPPMFSAKKVGGKKLYELARKGIEIERSNQTVTVYSITLEDFDAVGGSLNVVCSKGTYIRTVIHDIGQFLGTGAVMTALTRLSSGSFTIAGSLTFEQIEELARGNALQLIPVESLFMYMPEIRLNESETVKYKNGVKLKRPQYGEFRIYADSGGFLGIGSNENGLLRVRKNF
ncbi:MAG: tRNA pseudouridine(55) synthase TruB [Oscillospiraceae bacterium]|jgi:tRNA pseudouridine55 synthase|nr:tRNA pseudouridine(55) synthase TruB [Oscillospiraceae bacterium]